MNPHPFHTTPDFSALCLQAFSFGGNNKRHIFDSLMLKEFIPDTLYHLTLMVMIMMSEG